MSTTTDIDIRVHDEISEQYLRIKTLNITPAASFWRKRTNIKSLLIFLLLVLITYVSCFSLYFHQMIMLYNKINIQSGNEIDRDAFKILQHMISNQDNCYPCIYNFTANDKIEQILKAHDNAIDQQAELTDGRLLLSLFAAFNVVVVYAVYGDPFNINVTLLLSAICLIVAPYLDTLFKIVALESSIVIVATESVIQSAYVLVVATIEIHTKSFRKID